MKRILTFTVLLALVATSAFALSFPDIGGWLKGASWGLVAMLLTAIIGLVGLATRAQWFSGLCLLLAAAINSIGALFATVGVTLQDGKIEGAELKGIRDACMNIGEQFKAAWKFITGAGKPADDGNG